MLPPLCAPTGPRGPLWSSPHSSACKQSDPSDEGSLFGTKASVFTAHTRPEAAVNIVAAGCQAFTQAFEVTFAKPPLPPPHTHHHHRGLSAPLHIHPCWRKLCVFHSLYAQPAEHTRGKWGRQSALLQTTEQSHQTTHRHLPGCVGVRLFCTKHPGVQASADALFAATVMLFAVVPVACSFTPHLIHRLHLQAVQQLKTYGIVWNCRTPNTLR